MRNGINDYEHKPSVCTEAADVYKLVLALPHWLRLSASEFAATLLLAVTAPAAGTFCEIFGTISLNNWSKVRKCCVAHFNG